MQAYLSPKPYTVRRTENGETELNNPPKLSIQKPDKSIPHLVPPQPAQPRPHRVITTDIRPIQANPLPLEPLQSGQGEHAARAGEFVRGA